MTAHTLSLRAFALSPHIFQLVTPAFSTVTPCSVAGPVFYTEQPIPSPYADHDHIRAKALSGQREQVRHDSECVFDLGGRSDLKKHKFVSNRVKKSFVISLTLEKIL